MKTITIAAAGLSLLMLGACGGGQDNPNQPSADERGKLDNIAAKQDAAETFDTSPDSLKPADDNAALGNASDTAQPANGVAPANGSNAAAPR